jgi:hypothetical protein
MKPCHLIFSLGVALLCTAGVVRAAPSGSLFITDHRISPSPDRFEKELKAAATSVLARNSGENWRVHFVAYLKKAPASEDVNVVFYAVDKGKRELVNAFPIHTRADARILMSEVEIKPEDGFKPGGKYQVLITRLVSGKEDIFAKTTLELKE